MATVNISNTVSNDCVNFSINNLKLIEESELSESNFKIYDVFLELGNGDFYLFIPVNLR